MKKIIIIAVSLLVIASFLLAGCSTTTTTTATQTVTNTQTATQSTTTTQTATVTATPTDTGTINLGIGLPLSGAFAASAPYQTGVAQMLADDVNAAGGLLGGRKLAIIQRDNAGDPSLMPQVLNQLKQQGCVSIFGIIGGADSVDFQWATTNHIPVFGSNGDNVERTKDFSKYGFYVGPMDLGLTQVLAQHIIPQTNIKSMYMLAGDITFAHETWDSLWPILSKARPDIKDLGQTYVGVSESDFSATVNSIIAKKPDYLFCLLGGPIFVTFLQQAKQFDLVSQMNIGGIYTLGSQTTGPFGKDYLVGLQSIDFMPYWMNTPAMTAFVQEHYKATGLYPDNLTAFFESWMRSITQAIKTANSTDPDKLVAALENMTFDASVGSIKVDSYDHQYEIPLFYSTSGYTSDFPFAVGLNTQSYLQGIYPSEADITAMRSAP